MIYIHIEFPKFLYSKEFPQGKLVKNELEMGELEGDWYDTPADLPVEEVKKSKK